MATFSVGGLASGLDSNTIIDKLVELESTPITLLKARQAGVKTQISALADIAARLGNLLGAANSLRDGGALGVKVTSSNTAFSASPGSGAQGGTSSVLVSRLATNARALSAGFTAGEVVADGTLTLSARGKTYAFAIAGNQLTTTVDGVARTPVTLSAGATLSELSSAIRLSGAPVSANVLDDGTQKYLSVVARDSGYPLTGVPADALAVSFAATGGGKVPGFVGTDAVNADLTVDGVRFRRTSNTVTDAVPGVTLTLKALSAGVLPDGSGGTAEQLTLVNDADSTQTKLKTFVDAYNVVAAAVQRQLAVTKDTDRAASLAGDATLRTLQGRLRALVTTSATGGTGIRSLTDLGIRSGADGQLTISSTTLASAIAADAGAIGSIFTTANTGLAALVKGLSDTYTTAGTGLLAARQDSLNAQIKRMDASAADLQRRVDLFRSGLVRQFTAMEKVVSQLKSTGTFLTAQLNRTSS